MLDMILNIIKRNNSGPFFLFHNSNLNTRKKDTLSLKTQSQDLWISREQWRWNQMLQCGTFGEIWAGCGYFSHLKPWLGWPGVSSYIPPPLSWFIWWSWVLFVCTKCKARAYSTRAVIRGKTSAARISKINKNYYLLGRVLSPLWSDLF